MIRHLFYYNAHSVLILTVSSTFFRIHKASEVLSLNKLFLMSDHLREEGPSVLTGSQIVACASLQYTGLVPGYARKNPARDVANEIAAELF